MRTRFLATDYSAATAAVGGGQLECLDFVRLPLPRLPPPNYPSFSASLLHSFDEIPAVGISSEIDKLPIDDALSIFLSDVLPHFVDGSDFEERSGKEKFEDINSEKLDLQRRTEICCGEKELEKDGTTSDNTFGNGITFVKFEIPEMDISFLPSPKSVTHSQMECLQVLSEVSDTECTMDLLNSEIRLHNHLEIQESVYSVDDMSLEYSIEQKADLLEDAASVQGEVKSNNIKFPLFEVNVESLGILGKTYVEDELLSFENIGKQQLAQPDVVISKNNELLGSMEFDLVKYLLHSCVETQYLEDTNVSLQLEYISIIELSHCQQFSTFHHVEPDDDLTMGPIRFDEFMFLDFGLYHFFEVFSDAAKKIEVETCESMFGEAMNFRSFTEMIVCHELILMDDSFKSLPAPIFSDHGITSSLHTLVEELLAQLVWQSPSASDGLYLDWHFLEDDCESAKYSSCWKMLWDIDTYNIDAAMNSSDNGKLLFNFIISEGHSNKPNAENSKETLNLSSSDVAIVHTSSGKADSSSLNNRGDGKRINEDVLQKSRVEKVPIFGESMSSDLEFFLNPRNYNTAKENIPVDKSNDTNTLCQVLTSSDASAGATNAPTGVHQKWDVKLHQVQLSDNIQQLIDYLWKNFLALLENDKELIQMCNQYQASGDLTLLHLPKEKLQRRLQEINASNTYFAQNDDDIMVLAMLCAIKQMAFYLCYYGIQATYLYLDKLSASLQCIKSRLSSLYNLVRDENQKAEKELSIVHPSISVVQEILQTRLRNNSSKFLVVADQVFWWPLKRLLNLLKISHSEPQYCFIPPSQQSHCCEITDTMVDIMLNSDCCLVSHDYVSASFPISKFSFIVEYGGSNGSSRISSICPKSEGLPSLYFLKLEVEESSIAKALSHGIDMPKKIDLDSTSAKKESKSKLEELLDTIPLKETFGNGPVGAVNEDEDCSMLRVQSLPVGLESEKNLSCRAFCPDTVIIVNTRNFNEEVVISRRSTYQRILELEQEGTQVVERDICLPVDIIVSSAISLTWYDCRNIGKKASAPDEAFSCLPLCVESIAASILTSLSFAFSCCILIFEGECNFLGGIMESSDELYAAAASLGIDIQLFCSYSSEMTEEIILSCINVAAKLSRGLYPKMSDSESLAESFLTAFPSINPLSAHAVLSSDAMLGKFLELSNGGRICALKKYQVPDESISLLTAISRYGEREDSKSGMTDCSSSVSAPDSENVQFESACDRKKPKYTHNLYNDVEPPNDLFHIGSLNLLPDDQLNPPKLSLSHSSWLSESAEISDKQFGLSFEDKLLSHSQEFDADMMRPINKSSLYEFPVARGLEMSDEKEKPCMPRINIDSNPRLRSAAAAKNNFSRPGKKVPKIPQEDFVGEVIDVEDTLAFTENFSVPKPGSFSPFLLDAEKDYAARNSRISKRSLDATNLPMFTIPADIHSAPDVWMSGKGNRQNLREEIKPPHFGTIRRNDISMKCQKDLVEEDIIQKAPENSYEQAFHENNTRSFGSTPLSNALHSNQLRQGSPWTIEFLNRIREKSRLHKQSVSYDLSSPSFGSSGNISKITKRKSPSILEFYKYKGGSTPQKIVDQKRPKRSSEPLNSLKNKKASNSCPSWTPVDKRARRTLSFSSNGGGGQSKLIWSDNNSRNTQRRL
ncbi:hypothetical protein BUALT_Bualt06G0111800 [Buddleja alternifolia]|uniref:Protein SHORTAGE IN CHIASMATA 1 n=1 Tax=Buddleja alternifolia TaxID=168488 RepID=A0AAV6XEH3_9LAMI|nr:hypothetical protein BUALT_Bualt06G0111800 [Buddleja alternifolia]